MPDELTLCNGTLRRILYQTQNIQVADKRKFLCLRAHKFHQSKRKMLDNLSLEKALKLRSEMRPLCFAPMQRMIISQRSKSTVPQLISQSMKITHTLENQVWEEIKLSLKRNLPLLQHENFQWWTSFHSPSLRTNLTQDQMKSLSNFNKQLIRILNLPLLSFLKSYYRSKSKDISLVMDQYLMKWQMRIH